MQTVIHIASAMSTKTTLRVKEVRIHRPNNRPDIVMYPLNYWDAHKSADYFEKEYPNSGVEIVYDRS